MRRTTWATGWPIGLVAIAVAAASCGSSGTAAPATTPISPTTPTSGDSRPGDSRPGDSRAGNGSGGFNASGAPAGNGAQLVGPEALVDEAVILMPVERGDTGDEVTALQEHLAALGFELGDVDGNYGPQTVAAVTSFQMVAGLEPTGGADPATVDALGSFRYDGPVLIPGDEGPEVAALQARLAAGPFDPGPVDGTYGTATIEAVWALAKLAGMPVDGSWGPADELALELITNGAVGPPTVTHDRRWVEVDLSDQLMKVYDPGRTVPTLVSHVSTGSGIPWTNANHSGSSITPTGSFEIHRRIDGWRESSLGIGRLYNPLYFVGGIAFHGALSVPLHPASHGCVRVPMHIAEYLPDELPDGTPVEVVT